MGSRIWPRSERRAGVAERLAGSSVSSLLAFALLSFVCVGSASAMRIEFPDDPLLSDPATSRRLEVSSGGSLTGGQYSFEITAPPQGEPGFMNLSGDRITIQAEASFADADGNTEFMVVFTSVRVGAPDSVTCAELAPGGALPFGDFSYVADSILGGVVRHTTPSDGMMGGDSQVCNAEDATPFFGLVFAPTSSDPVPFSFQIETTVDNIPAGDFAQIRLLKQGYSAVPEPSTAFLLVAGLAGLAVWGRRTPRLA